LRLILSRTKPEADAVVGILGQGASFEAVATERSIDEATRFSGGDLGYSTLDVLPAPYAAALQGQTPGAVVGPIQTETGWAVLKVEDRRVETPPTLDQARPQIVRYLTYEGVRQLLEQLHIAAAAIGGHDIGEPAAAAAAPAVLQVLQGALLSPALDASSGEVQSLRLQLLAASLNLLLRDAAAEAAAVDPLGAHLSNAAEAAYILLLLAQQWSAAAAPEEAAATSLCSGVLQAAG
jgi:hypothetical protein